MSEKLLRAMNITGLVLVLLGVFSTLGAAIATDRDARVAGELACAFGLIITLQVKDLQVKDLRRELAEKSRANRQGT
jgi:hypothetical protein